MNGLRKFIIAGLSMLALYSCNSGSAEEWKSLVRFDYENTGGTCILEVIYSDDKSSAEIDAYMLGTNNLTSVDYMASDSKVDVKYTTSDSTEEVVKSYTGDFLYFTEGIFNIEGKEAEIDNGYTILKDTESISIKLGWVDTYLPLNFGEGEQGDTVIVGYLQKGKKFYVERCQSNKEETVLYSFEFGGYFTWEVTPAA